MSDPISKSIWINAPREIVFQYFTDGDKMQRWSGLSANLDPQPGGIYELDMGVAGVFRGRFIEVVEPEKVIYEVDSPEGFESSPSRVEITLTDDLGGTRVEVKHFGLPDPFPLVASRGWDHHLARLSVAAQGGSPGDDPLCAKPIQFSP